MRIKLLDDCNGTQKGTIVDCDDVQGAELVSKGVAEISQIDESGVVQEVNSIIKSRECHQKEIKMKIEQNEEFAMGAFFADLGRKCLSQSDMSGIVTKSITGNSETGSAADGGAVVYTGLADLAPLLLQGSVVYSKCRKIPISPKANAMKVPFSANDWYIASNAPVVSSTIAEGIAGSDTKMVFGARTLTLGKAVVPVAITEELLEDNASVDAFVRAEMVGKLGAILDGNVIKNTANGLTAILGDTGYCATATVSGTTTLTEMVAFQSKVHPSLKPEWYMSITMWNKIVGTFTTAANIEKMLIDVSNKVFLGKPVNVMPQLGATDIVYADFSQYTVVESTLGQKMAVSVDARFLYGEICFRLTARQAGAITLPTRATADSLTVSGFVSQA